MKGMTDGRLCHLSHTCPENGERVGETPEIGHRRFSGASTSFFVAAEPDDPLLKLPGTRWMQRETTDCRAHPLPFVRNQLRIRPFHDVGRIRNLASAVVIRPCRDRDVLFLQERPAFPVPLPVRLCGAVFWKSRQVHQGLPRPAYRRHLWI